MPNVLPKSSEECRTVWLITRESPQVDSGHQSACSIQGEFVQLKIML
uniref:Uncharacterized protein n=1 Tax=Anguilla anguilla TaxID=7936 RepID=A0A0E9UA27_ANGAN